MARNDIVKTDGSVDWDYMGNKFDNHDAQIATNATKINYPKKQTEAIGSFYKKLTHGDSVVIVTEGDSLTYGQDTTSGDIRAAATTLTDNGTAHTLTRAGITYPENLQTNLQAIYGTQVTVINKGYSGDWADASYNHWNIDSNADIAFLMLGTNDSNLSATWVPSAIRGDLIKYIADMRRIIERYLDWGTGVILLTPPRLQNQENFKTTTDFVTESYRNALFQLGKEYNAPVIDAEIFLNGCDTTYYSDSIHLNTKGYTTFASRLTSSLIGMWNSIPRIKSGDSIGLRTTRDNFIYSGTTLGISTGGFGAEESTNGNGIYATLYQNGWVHYSFITEEEDLVLIPIFSTGSGGIMEAKLDFGTEQGSYNMLSAVNQGIPQGTKPLSVISTSTVSNNSSAWDGTITTTTTDRYILITQKGLHNLKISNTSGAGSSVYLNGIVVVSYKDFIKFGIVNQVIKKNYVKINFPETYITPNASTSSYDLSIQTLLDNFDLPNITTNYYKEVPLRIILTNITTTGPTVLNVIEYAFMFNDTVGDGTNKYGFVYLGEIRRTNNGTPSNFRTITNITYDYVNKKYVITFGGTLDCYSNMLITLL